MPAKLLTIPQENEAVALVESGYKLSKVAKMFNCSYHTIRRAKEKYDANKKEVMANASDPKMVIEPARQHSVESLKERLSYGYDTLITRILGHFTEEKLQKASARDLGIVMGIASDKLFQIKGLNNQVVNHNHAIVGLIRSNNDKF